MQNRREEIYEMLTEAIGNAAAVYYAYPDKDAEYPCVSYYENGNSDQSRADAAEYLTEITYQVDVWTQNILQADAIAALIDGGFAGIGWKRQICYDIPEPGLCHRTMRYRALVAPDGSVYQ